LNALLLNERFPPPDQSHWRILLDAALPALDHVFPTARAPGELPDWTLGGGTALAMSIEHRLSYDIDIFVAKKGLREFVPGRNPYADSISPKLQWPGYYVKFQREEGEVDFLQAHLLTEPGFVPLQYRGREVALETPTEIIAKKIRYRAATFTPRDVFDLAATNRSQGNMDKVVATYAPDMVEILIDRISTMRPASSASVVVPTPEFADLLTKANSEALAILKRAEKIVEMREKDGSKNRNEFRPKSGPTAINMRRNGKDDDGQDP
jgi:hypothetical protein